MAPTLDIADDDASFLLALSDREPYLKVGGSCLSRQSNETEPCHRCTVAKSRRIRRYRNGFFGLIVMDRIRMDMDQVVCQLVETVSSIMPDISGSIRQ